MIELSGSEKQVAWASEIRDGLYTEWQALTAKGLAQLDAMLAPLGNSPLVAAERAAQVAQYAATEAKIFGHAEAGWWINTAAKSRLSDLIAATK